MTEQIRTPRLIQRLKFSDNKEKTGVDRYFNLPYMGSAEFESYEVPDSLKAMRAQLATARFPWVPIKMVAWRFEAHYVGPPEHVTVAEYVFRDQTMSGPTLRFQERPWITESYRGLPEDKYFTCDGWWAIDRDKSFAMFKRRDHALLWLQQLNNAPKPKDSSKKI